MKTIDLVYLIIGPLILLWFFAHRVRKGIIRRCFVEIVVEDGQKIPIAKFTKKDLASKSVKRCACTHVKRSYSTILPIGETVSFFARPKGALRFRGRIYDVFKSICCYCPDCKSTTCIDAKRHDSISVIHGYWIMLKEGVKHRLGVDYNSEFFLDDKTKTAIAQYGDILKNGKYSQLDGAGSLPPTMGNVADAVVDALKNQ
jgi:hypothetical protein